MKKLIHRRCLVCWIALAIVLLIGAIDLSWRGATHKGVGWIYEGGEDSDGSWEKVSESQYRQEYYGNAILLSFIAAIILWGAIAKWREIDDLEKSWRKIISNPENIRDIHKNPHLYRDDFKQWIKDNHPHLAFWELPRNSSN